MDSPPGSADFDIALVDLVENARNYSFYQINLIVERYLKSIGHRSQAKASTQIRYAANKSLVFPSADIDGIGLSSSEAGDTINITVTFMGLYGPASPLPAYFTERLLHTDDESEAARQFLDLCNNHMISMLQAAWEKYRYYIQFHSNAQDQLSKWVLDLAGLPSINRINELGLSWRKLMPLAGLFSLKVKNASALSSILNKYFYPLSFDIEECVSRVFDIPEDQLSKMGMEASLMGVNIVLGSEVYDNMNKFRVHVHNLDDVEFNEMLPNSPKYRELKSLIGLYMRDQLAYDICLHAELESKKPLSMGSETSYLGWNICIGDTTQNQHLVVIN